MWFLFMRSSFQHIQFTVWKELSPVKVPPQRNMNLTVGSTISVTMEFCEKGIVQVEHTTIMTPAMLSVSIKIALTAQRVTLPHYLHQPVSSTTILVYTYFLHTFVVVCLALM